MTFIFDAHTHYTPPSLKENLKTFGEKEPFWGLLITPDSSHNVQGWATAERMIADMDQGGVDKAVILGAYRQTAENARETNDETLEVMQKYKDHILGFGVVAPHPLSEALDEVKRCVDSGMLGIGELNPYGQGISFEDPNFLTIVEACIDANLVLNLHVSEEVGHFYLGKSTTRLLDYYHLAYRYPELKLVLAHWGGGLFFYEIMPEVRRTLKNVYYDTATTPLLYPTQSIFNVALQCVSHKKLLYGSDYPLIVYPRKQKEPDFWQFLNEIKELGLPEDVYEDVMGKNAARLFGMLPSEPVEETEVQTRKSGGDSRVITEIQDPKSMHISGNMAISAVASAWPVTRQVFEKYGIPWKDTPVPFWEPIAQAAAAQMMGPKVRQQLINDLNDAIGYKEPPNSLLLKE